MKLALAFTLATMASQVQAWFGKGHLLVARIAYDILDEKSPETIEKVENVLKILQESDPSWTQKEGDHPMVECATFADDIKGKGGAYQSPWHFVDRPYLDQGGQLSDFNFTIAPHNITEAINGITAWFNRAPGYQNSYIYQQVMGHGVKGHTEQDAMSTAMRLLIHYAGDIHQPLHCTSRVDENYPKGDRGGNDVPLASRDGINELHAVWDSVLYEYEGYADLPFDSEDWDAQGRNTSLLVEKYPIDGDQARDLDPENWAIQSFDISRSFVYRGVQENGSLSDTYVKRGNAIAEQQIVLAGHRLANLLMSLDLDEFSKDRFDIQNTRRKDEDIEMFLQDKKA